MEKEKKLLDDLIESLKSHDFSYMITKDLDYWKKGINTQYLLKKQIQSVVEVFGEEEATRIMKICLDKVQNNMVGGLVHRTIKELFLPYNYYNTQEDNTSSIRLQQARKSKR